MSDHSQFNSDRTHPGRNDHLQQPPINRSFRQRSSNWER